MKASKVVLMIPLVCAVALFSCSAAAPLIAAVVDSLTGLCISELGKVQEVQKAGVTLGLTPEQYSRVLCSIPRVITPFAAVAAAKIEQPDASVMQSPTELALDELRALGMLK